MALEIDELIKIIIAILVIGVVVGGVYLIFKNQIFDFFKGLSVEDAPAGIFLSLIK